MKQFKQAKNRFSLVSVASGCALGLTLLLPGMVEAANIHAIVSTPSTNTSLDATSFFNLLMISLAELGAIFWVGAQFWLNFVLQAVAEKAPVEQEIANRVEQRFARVFSLPTLTLLLLANVGVLYGQVLMQTNGNWSAALSLTALNAQATGGRSGTYWTLRIIVLLLAIVVGLYRVVSKKRPHFIEQALPLVNLFLGAMLFVAMAVSGDTAGVTAVPLTYTLVIDWLHLIAAALWIGGTFAIFLVYLPVLKTLTTSTQARSLVALLTQYLPLALIGVVIMAITGPLSTTFALNSPGQLATTAYGRSLLSKSFLVGVLLTTSAWYLLRLRPRLKREYQKYTHSLQQMEKNQRETSDETSGETERSTRRHKRLSQQTKMREQRLTRKITLLASIVRWEAGLGVAVIVCVGLMNVFAGTLTLAKAAQPTPQAQLTPTVTNAPGPYTGTGLTSDGKFRVALTVSPNHFGANLFTVKVTNALSGASLSANEVGVTVYTTSLDMDMGTDNIDLQPDAKGGFSATQDLPMSGNWSIGVDLRTTDHQIHKANFTIVTPF